jgi:branched-subunit amino acid permease
MSDKDESTMSDKDESTPPPVAMSKQLTRMSCAILAILIMNIALTLAGIVIGIQVKTQVDQLEEELGPVMELAETLASAAGGAGAPNN